MIICLKSLYCTFQGFLIMTNDKHITVFSLFSKNVFLVKNISLRHIWKFLVKNKRPSISSDQIFLCLKYVKYLFSENGVLNFSTNYPGTNLIYLENFKLRMHQTRNQLLTTLQSYLYEWHTEWEQRMSFALTFRLRGDRKCSILC